MTRSPAVLVFGLMWGSDALADEERPRRVWGIVHVGRQISEVLIGAASELQTQWWMWGQLRQRLPDFSVRRSLVGALPRLSAAPRLLRAVAVRS